MNIRIPVANATLTEEDAQAVADAVRSGRISSGPRVHAFEEAFASYAGVRHAVAVNNGTSALHVVLAALGIGPGDEVIVPSLTFIATANAVLYQGAKPVLCECDPKTYNVTADTVSCCITPRTKAVIPVEMNGLPLDYAPLLRLSGETGVPMIVDSAESLGSGYEGRPTGSQGLAHIFSFFPNKTVTTGEGGMVTTGDSALATRVRTLINQGQDGRYNHVALGFNYRMNEMQAALGLSQLKRISWTLRERERIAHRYDRAFAGRPGIEPPTRPSHATAHSWYMYSVRLRDRAVRDAAASALAERGIETRLSFPPVHIQPYYRDLFNLQPGDFPVSLRAWERKLDIPAWPGLPESQQDEVIDALAAATAPAAEMAQSV